MSQLLPLDSVAHRGLRVRAEASVELGDGRHFVPVVPSEFHVLATHYPLLLSKDAHTGAFYCGALQGFVAGENLLAPAQRARVAYRPLNLQRGPFYVAGDSLAIDLGHARVTAGGGEALFDEAGKPTPYLASILSTLEDLRAGEEATRSFLAALLEARLVEPVQVDLSFDDGSRLHLEGLYTIDRAALASLADAKALEFFRRGYLQLAYLMIASLKHIPVLAQMRNQGMVPTGIGA